MLSEQGKLSFPEPSIRLLLPGHGADLELVLWSVYFFFHVVKEREVGCDTGVLTGPRHSTHRYWPPQHTQFVTTGHLRQTGTNKPGRLSLRTRLSSRLWLLITADGWSVISFHLPFVMNSEKKYNKSHLQRVNFSNPTTFVPSYLFLHNTSWKMLPP